MLLTALSPCAVASTELAFPPHRRRAVGEPASHVDVTALASCAVASTELLFPPHRRRAVGQPASRVVVTALASCAVASTELAFPPHRRRAVGQPCECCLPLSLGTPELLRSPSHLTAAGARWDSLASAAYRSRSAHRSYYARLPTSPPARGGWDSLVCAAYRSGSAHRSYYARLPTSPPARGGTASCVLLTALARPFICFSLVTPLALHYPSIDGMFLEQNDALHLLVPSVFTSLMKHQSYQ